MYITFHLYMKCTARLFLVCNGMGVLFCLKRDCDICIGIEFEKYKSIKVLFIQSIVIRTMLFI